MRSNRSLSAVRGAVLFLGAAACGAGCSAPEQGARVFGGEGVGQRGGALLGSDSSATITTSTVINQYFRVTADVAAGATTIQVTPGGMLSMLKPGDLALLHQAQGAKIDSTDAATYGQITDLKGAGLYELFTVESVNTGTGAVGVAAGCGRTGTRNAYSASGKAQLVRVPQYSTLTVQNGGAISATPWNGTTGGIVAVVAESAVIDGTIAAAGGFQGGAAAVNVSTANFTGYRTSTLSSGGQKGEGVAGGTAEYTASFGGSFGRGAPANGGGGGNSYNAAGGGGAGVSNGAVYSGAGVMDLGTYPQAAWRLDPEYDTANNNGASSSGGGRGGYALSSAALDPLTVPPGDASWGGASRAQLGGRGGHPINPSQSRLFFGGGGGAGHGDNVIAAIPNAGRGGTGGGVLLLLSASLGGTGVISADGQPGADSMPPAVTIGTDGPGGGGGGGGILISADSTQGSLRFSARGGAGGAHKRATMAPGPEATGGGGGGGGGGVTLAGPGLGNLMARVDGGAAGTTNADALAAFKANGATDGAAGSLSRPVAALRDLICAPADLRVVVTDSLGGNPAVPGQELVFTVEVRNDGPNPARRAQLTDKLPRGATGVFWTCSSATAGACPAPAGSGSLAGPLDLPSGAAVTFSVTVPIAPGIPDLSYSATIAAPSLVSDSNPANNSATAVVAGTGPLTADLTLSLAEAAVQPSPESRVFELIATNPDKSEVDQAQIALRVPAGGVLEVSGERWECTRFDSFVRCVLGLLSPGEIAPPVQVTVQRSCAERPISADLTSSAQDPDKTNNHVEITREQLGAECPALSGGGLGGCSASGVAAGGSALGPTLLLLLGLGVRRRRR
jgi:uncharacterized repeat protein (TIGR01451 family)/uncharacterized protein (TIGR03382 family)